MRALVVITFVAIVLSSLEARSGSDGWCSLYAGARKQLAALGITPAAPTALPSHRSSFKGITLGLTPAEVTGTLFREGFELWASTYVSPPDKVSSIEVCRHHGQVAVGRIDFDQSGHVHRLALQAEYFFEKGITVREFAERVFRHYKVRPDEVEDDACFQDVTCFRGRTDGGEQFLILRISGRITLYVRPLKAGE